MTRGLRLESLEERRLLSLTAAGPVHPVNGFPTWFEDSNGVRVELMPYYQGQAPFTEGTPPAPKPGLVPDTLSLAAPPEPGDAFSEAIGFGEEAFYWSADATMAVPGGQALLVMAQEAAFPNGPPTDGDQFAFGRVRVRMDAQFDGTYTVTTPYGDLPSFTVTAGPNAINFTNDVGDVPPFAALQLDQNPIGPFLVATNAPAGYMGNPLQPSTVTGSPTGQNVFAITGPFNGPGTSVTLTTDLFTVSGRRFLAEPPVVAQPIADVVVPVNAAPTAIDTSGVFTNPDIPQGDVLTLSVTSSNPAVVAASLNPAGTQLTLTYGANQSGSANITLRATDLDGLFVEDVFTATVSPFSNPPSVVPPGLADATAAEDAASLVIDLSGSFADPDFANGDVLTFSAVSADPNLAAASVAGAELTLTLQPNASGVTAVTVTATDQAGQSVSDTFSLTVTPVNNDPPIVAQPIVDRTALVNALPLVIDLAAVFTDPDLPNGDVLTLSATSDTPGPVTATVTGTKLTLAFQPNSSGVATVSVTATDSTGLAVTDTFTATLAGFSEVEPVSAISGLTGNRPSLLDNVVEQVTSADGRFVVFTSQATDLAGAGNDLNGILFDVFLYDRAVQSVTLISRKAGTLRTANGDSLSPMISDDGTKIAFLSAATNLVPGQIDANAVEDLFLFDTTTGTMSLVSHIPGLPVTAGDGSVLSATMSADGTAIAFDSLATNLVTLGLASAAFTNPGGRLVAAGAPDPYHGFPAWYQDSNGVAVDLMPFYQGQAPFNNGQVLVPDPMSISAPPTPGNTFSEIIGFDDEAFWWAADTSVDMGAFGSGLLTLALEAAFMGDASAVMGNQFAFGRIRTRFDVPVDGTYTVTHPFGEIVLPDLVAGDRLFYSNDNGDLYPYLNGRLLSTNPVGPFLVATNAPAGYLGDPALPSTVTGSPVGPDRNYFSIRGPFNGPGTDVEFRTDLFTVVGRRYTTDKNNAPDVYLWKAAPATPGGVIELVSHAAGSTVETGNGASRNPIIDPSGASVLYTSDATNLVALQNDTNGFSDVFLFNDQLQTTALVSGAGGSQTVTANGASQAEAIDSVGAFAVVSSTANNLATELDAGGAIVPVAIQDTNLGRDIYLFDAGTRVMKLVSHTSGDPHEAANAPSAAPRISADGRFVAFTSTASDVAAGVTDAAAFQDLFLYDRFTDTSELVSHAAGAPTTPANSDSSAPVLSFDGRFVAFESLATDLVGLAVDANAASDIFVLDRAAGAVKLISEIPVAAPGDTPTAGNGASTHPMISADGRSIVFNSIASNLFPSDGNAVSDVFLYSGVTNSAPALDPAIRPSLAPVNEGTRAGTTVDAILATAGLYSDPDGTAFMGVAVVGQDTINGTWEYSTDGGAVWTPFGVVGDNQAILLSADGGGQNRVRFVPTDPLFVGTATFNFRGWDRTDGNASGATGINVSINGGERAYSAEIATADAPITPAGQHQPTVVQPIADRTALGNVPIVIQLGAVFADADIATNGDQLALSVGNSNPGLLTASLTGTQLTLTFQPNPAGTATVSVTATDLAGAQVVDEFIVSIGQPPAAQPIPPVTVAEDSAPAQVDLAGIFSDPDGDPLALSLVNNNNPGLVTAALQGTLVTLTFAPNQNGAATVFVMATDPTGLTVTAPIAVNVTPVNDAPAANAQTAAMNEDTSRAVALTASDIDGDPLTYAVVTGPAHGNLSGTAPNLTYTPAANYNGPDSFTFKVNDGTVDSALATVSISVAPVNDAPVASAQAVTANEDTPTAIVLAGSDVDGNPLTYTVVTAPLRGTLTGAVPNLTYTPAPDYFGADSFTFKVNDGTLDSAASAVSITVNGVAPAATIDQAATQRAVAVDGPIHFTATFADPVTGFDGADLRLSGTASGSLVATITPVDADGMIYDVAVNGMTGRGTVIAQIRADAAVDRAGHPSTASTSTDNEVFFEPPQVSDNLDPSFAFTGSWGAHPGYRSGALVSLNRAAGTAATWTMPVTPGQYQVLLTWTAGGAHAQNAPFTIFDGGVATARASVNQRLAPAGVTFDGVNWRSLGTFSIYGNSLAVGLNAVANGSVDADAVRIVRLGDLTPTTTRIVDDGDTFFASQGAWATATVGFQRDVRRNTRGTGADTATWTFLVEPGQYQVAATWAALTTGATNAPFTVTGATSFTTPLNQRIAPNDFTDAGVGWENLGTMTVTGNVLTVRLSDLANGTVTADAIRIQKVAGPGAAAASQSASARVLDATLAALAASSRSPQFSSATVTPQRQQAAVDAILADPAAQLQLL